MKKVTKVVAMFMVLCLCITSASIGSAAQAAKKSSNVTIQSKKGTVIIKVGEKTVKINTGLAANKNAITVSTDRNGNTIVTVIGKDGKKKTQKLGVKAEDIRFEGSASKLTVKDALESTNVILAKSSNISSLSSTDSNITVNGTVKKASTTGGSLMVAEKAKVSSATVKDAELIVSGTISGTMTAKGDSSVEVNGTVSKAKLEGNSGVSVNAGAKLTSVTASNESTLKIEQGAVVKNLSASGESDINIAGNVTGTIKAEGKVEVNALKGAMVNKLEAEGNAVIKANSGSYVKSMEASEEASLTMKKGAEAYYITTGDNAQAKIAGSVNNVIVKGDAEVSVNKGAQVANVYNSESKNEVVLGKGSTIGTVEDTSMVKDNGATINPDLKDVVEDKQIDSKPVANPTPVPTKEPTQAPTTAPTKAPTETPTQGTTESPTQGTTQTPTTAPTTIPKIIDVKVTDATTVVVTLDKAKAGLKEADFTAKTGETALGEAVNVITNVTQVGTTAEYTITLKTPIEDGHYIVIAANGKNLDASSKNAQYNAPLTVELQAVSRNTITFKAPAKISGIKVEGITVSMEGTTAPYASFKDGVWTVTLTEEQGLIAGKSYNMIVGKNGHQDITTSISYIITATSSEELKEALATAKNDDIINISGTIGNSESLSKNDIYTINKAVTIKGADPNTSIVNGSFIAKGDGIVFDGLTIANPGDKDGNGETGALRCGINYYGKKITINHCIFKMTGSKDIICNGVVLYPSDTSVDYIITNNTFDGFIKSQDGYSSTGLLIANGYDLNSKSFFDENQISDKAAFTDNQNLAFIKDNTFNNCQNDYGHSDYSTNPSTVITTSNSKTDNFRLEQGIESGSKHYVKGNVELMSSSEIKAKSELIVMEGATLTIAAEKTLTVKGTLIVNGAIDGNIADKLKGEGTIVVNSKEALDTAVSSEISNIKLGSDIVMDKNIIVKRQVTINGDEKTLTFTHNVETEGINDSVVFYINSQGSTLKNITIKQTGNTVDSWQGSYCVQVYTLQTDTAVTLENVTATGGDAGILVNGSKVDLKGTVDVSNNEAGGIEVSKGDNVSTNPKLEAINVTLKNESEVSGKPTVWIDQYSSESNNWVTGVTTTPNGCAVIAKGGKQYHFYLKTIVQPSLGTQSTYALPEDIADSDNVAVPEVVKEDAGTIETPPVIKEGVKGRTGTSEGNAAEAGLT